MTRKPPPVRMGRPPRSTKPAEHRVTIRLTDAELTKLLAAVREDESVSVLLRDSGLREADRRLKK